jgi:hypothetical protein
VFTLPSTDIETHVEDNDQPMTNGFEILSNGPDKSCECRRVVVCHTSREAVFSELEPREKYFPMIASEEELAFFGMPPDAIQPLPEPVAENRGLTQPTRHNESQEGIPFEEPSVDMVVSDDESEHLSTDNTRDQHKQRNETGQRSHSARASTVQSRPSSVSGAQVVNSAPIPQPQSDDTQWEQEKEQLWSNWEKESLQSTFDLLFVSRNLLVSPQSCPFQHICLCLFLNSLRSSICPLPCFLHLHSWVATDS